MQLDEDAFRKLAPRRAPIELARAEPGDLHSLVSIRTAGFGGDAREAEEEIRRWLGEEDQQIHIARSAGEAIGMVRLSRYESDGFIQSLAVLPAHRGRGFGRTILAHGVDALLADDREPILLEVETDNRAALGLYHACGFREISTYRYYGLRS